MPFYPWPGKQLEMEALQGYVSLYSLACGTDRKCVGNSCRIQCAKGSGTVQLPERIWASFILCSFDQTTLPFEAASRAESSSAGEVPLFQDPRLLFSSSRGPPLSPNAAAVLHCSEVKVDTWVTACFLHSHALHHSLLAL